MRCLSRHFPGSTADDIITVDDTADFTVGGNIEFFLSNGTTKTLILKSKTTTTITVPHLDINLPLYSGVKLVSNNNVFTTTLDLIPQAYGVQTTGIDGGAFVEFTQLATGSTNIPKFNEFQFSNIDKDRVAFEYCEYWHLNTGDNTNILQLVSANRNSDNTSGTSDTGAIQNSVFITIGNFNFTNNIAAIDETTVHEIAHQFEVFNAHVDQPVNEKNINNDDECVMSYNRDRDNNIAEFDINCIYDIKDAIDPR